jgi:hypothetical protein
MDKEQLGFDPTIVQIAGDTKYIEIERKGQKERLIIDQLIKRVPCVAGRATTCWKAYREGDDSLMPLVIKDSWQYPERKEEEEGDLLREATNKDVVNVARYYHHETVCIGSKEDDIWNNIRHGLDITQAANYGAENSPRNEARTTRNGQSSTTSQKRSSSRKRPSSQAGALMPPSKRSCLPSKMGRNNAAQNRIHRRVIIRDYGKSIYKSSSRAVLLAALEGCIEGYESLHTQAGILQCDISPGNLMINEEADNPSWRSFLIDLDLAIKEDQGFSSRGKTGTRAFMATGVLLGEKHSFMHDLESFFWVIFWICIHYDGPRQERVVPWFEKWNHMDMEVLAGIKLLVIEEEFFQQTASEYFTGFYQPLLPWVNRLRRVVFPALGGRSGRWKYEDKQLYSQMKEILRDAQKDLDILAE